MRIDKLTTKFQEALADAQSLAAGHDNQYIEPVHVLAALIAQTDGSARSLMSRAGVHVQALQGALNASSWSRPATSRGALMIPITRPIFGLPSVSFSNGMRRSRNGNGRPPGRRRRERRL